LKFKKRYILLVIVLLCALVISIFVQLDPKAGGQTSSEYAVQAAFPDLTFNQPDGILPDPNNANRLFILEQEGMIRVFDTQNASTSTVFLDISDRVLYGGEQGLLGLAFHPNYSQNRYFYVDYVADNPRRTVIARYTAMADDPNLADPNSQQIILEVNQPFSNHKGGQLAFGADSCLYIGMGDGGSAGDPMGNGQSLTTLLGKILRIDVNSPSADRNYGIPNDNPYAGNSLGYREEIYAYGFRNPWRFSFDSATGALWVGDVGQNRLEEINIVVKGKNYGWGIMEGSLCYTPAVAWDQAGLELPIWNYSRDMGYSVIGGFVYHGSALPSLIGAYVYGDYGSGRIWALRYNGVTAENTLLVDSGLNIASFGVDQNSELYFTAYDGKIYELVFIIPEFPPAAEGVVFLLAATVLFAVIVKKRKKFAIDWHIRDAKSRSKH
jgi:glucose/arabinose dehydrogenase